MGGLGVRKMRNMSLRFMAKLGWRLILEKHSMWDQIIHAKYIKGMMDTSKLIKKRFFKCLERNIVSNRPS